MSKYAGQVIIEKEFDTERQAVDWMAQVAGQHLRANVHVETHLWEDTEPKDRKKRA